MTPVPTSERQRHRPTVLGPRLVTVVARRRAKVLVLPGPGIEVIRQGTSTVTAGHLLTRQVCLRGLNYRLWVCC